MRYYIKTFGCQQNKADSERVAATFKARGMVEAQSFQDANYVVLNTCMIRRAAEDRVYGMVINLGKIKQEKIARGETYKIIVTGCMVGLAFRDKTGQFLDKIRAQMPDVDEFMPIEEVGFDHQPVRQDAVNGWVPISNGCNNFCTFCVVPFTRGREISRPYMQIIAECQRLKDGGYKTVTLLGQNVNSYGADLIVGEKNIQVMRDIDKTYFASPPQSFSPITISTTNHIEAGYDETNTLTYTVNGKELKPVYVRHLGRQRIPTLFPYLLEDVAKMGFEKVDFVSSNPWDFSEELVEVIARNPNITRTIHLPIQSGANTMLRRMNRWYTREEYIALTDKMKEKIPGVKFTTDIIVGFCGETDEEFQDTVDLARRVGFEKAYVSMYSVRPMTAATRVLQDDVPHPVKKKRWLVLEEVINKPFLIKHNIKGTAKTEYQLSPSA